VFLSRQNAFSAKTCEVYVYTSQVLARKAFWRKNRSYVHFSYFPDKMFTRQNSWLWRENARYEHFGGK